MASTPLQLLSILLPLLLLSALSSIAGHYSPELSPAPAPFSGGLSSAPFPSSPSPPSPHPSPDPAPSPSPEPFDLIEAEGEDQSDFQNGVAENEKTSGDGDGGLSAGKKAAAGIAAVAGAAVVGMGALVYKRRRDNIRRARYGYATRRDLL